jgi:uncharacterized protein
MLRALTPLESRVLGVLVEKAHTVPDSYPLSLNTLVLGCNQKTAREPVMNASETEVLGAVEDLRRLELVLERSGSRVARFEHNIARTLGLPSQSVALLSTLMLRGPQTSAELRANSERLHRFADLSSVEVFLQELLERAPAKGGALVAKLPRAPGSREARWAHMLCGEVDLPAAAPATVGRDPAQRPTDWEQLKQQQLELQAEVADLRALVERLYAELGVQRN